MAKRASDDSAPALRAKYHELSRKYSALVARGMRVKPAAAAVASTSPRVASVAVALIDAKGKIVQCSGRWKLIVSPALVRKLRSVLRRTAARPQGTIEQFRVPGRSGAYLVVRLEKIDHVTLAIASEEAVAWAADEERARSRLWQSERLRVLGELAASVAHDLSSTLRSVRYLLSSVQADEVVRSRCAEPLAAMARGVDDSSAVVAQLHAFARHGLHALQMVRVDSVLRDAIKLYELEEASARRVYVTLSVGSVPFVLASPGELTHVFLNLLRNARDATAGEGEISVICGRIGEVVRVSIADRGSGIDPGDLPRIFEPFFTTKGDKGTGLGLFICASLLERMGGRIRAGNRPKGRGAIFTVEIPVFSADGANQHSTPGESTPPASPPSKRALRARKRSSAA